MLAAHAVLVGLAVLRHQDDGRLDGRQHGQHQIQQDVGVGIEGVALPGQQHGIHADPDQHGQPEQQHKRPRTAKAGDRIGRALPQRALTAFQLLAKVA